MIGSIPKSGEPAIFFMSDDMYKIIKLTDFKCSIEDAYKQRRIGTFRIGDNILIENPYLFSEILSKMIVVRAEMMHICAAFEYIAYCPIFETVALGIMPNEYEMYFKWETCNNDNRCDMVHSFKGFKRVEYGRN